MKRTTSALLAGALATSGTVVLSVALPGIASASDCGNTTLTEHSFPTTFSTAESRSKGHNVVVDGGLHVYTDDASSEAKAAARFATQLDIPLADQTAESNYDLDLTVNSGGKPGYNLVVDMNGPAAGGFTTLVKEEGFYGDEWWTNSTAVQGVPAGGGYNHLGTIQEYSDANPEAVILTFGYSLGSGVLGDVTITKLRFGCNDFSFDRANRAPQASIVADDAGDADYRTFDFDGSGSTDPDGDALTYAWTFGDGSGGGGDVPAAAYQSHTYPKGAGTYTVTLTVTDPDGLSSTTEKIITVTPPTTVQDDELPNTGASVLGLAALGGVALLGGGAGLAATRRRRSTAHSA
ncbi:PKD domain-containing protein [Blastococcus sp. CT_GayMR20]|uniref:PKD domain-containing protein n=1 Tax=Blastococcus sp. CT_GayMR20 TaxID=2559609 RepID=UPI001073AF47|nr:PKD domain-containing protein [Blastococcus sp. CT_GayMR20]TFV86678.1 PKD domain-containing protein [Blastococcus sp. CT_GayMR20]